MPKKPNPLNATLLELPAGAGGTVLLGSVTRIHHGLQLGSYLVVETDATGTKLRQYELIRADGQHELAAAFQLACDRSQKVRPMKKDEQRDWTRAAEWAADQQPVEQAPVGYCARPPRMRSWSRSTRRSRQNSRRS